jgi:hypothetical protein
LEDDGHFFLAAHRFTEVYGHNQRALTEIGKEYTYTQEVDKVRITKLHGSVNWRLGLPEWRWWTYPPLDWQPLGFSEGMMDEDIYISERLLEWSAWTRYGGPLEEVRPFLVLPGFGKAFDVRAIAPLWYKAVWVFAVTHDVYIVGLSLSLDDYFIRSLFLESLPDLRAYSSIEDRRIFVINPDPSVRTNYGFIADNDNVEFIQDKFAQEHVELMRRRLDESSSLV